MNLLLLAITFTASTKTITMIAFGAIMFLGVVIVIGSKISGGNKDVYVEKEKNEISGLVDEKVREQEKEFDVDSIFKLLPSFSNKKFSEETSTALIQLLTGNTDISIINKDLIDKYKEKYENIELKDFKILDFTENDNSYEIKSIISFDHKIDKKKTETLIYKLVSVNTKDTKIERCPTCGGKIKDNTKLRCEFCGSILPNTKNVNNDEWIIEEIEKI